MNVEPIPAPESIDLIALAPVIVLSFFAMMVLVLDLFGGRNKTLLVFISLVGLLMTAISAFAKNPIPAYSFNDSYIVDHLSLFFICIFTISSALAILLSVEYNEREGIRAGEYYALILFCTVGMILLASSTDMIMIFLGIEIVSICLYVLAGIRRDNLRSNEAALKYFLLGAFATGFLLYGMTMVYGSTGSTNLFKIAEVVQNPSAQSNPLLLMGLVLLIIGFGFKVASVPFHMWAPDVYEGAPTPVTAYLAVGSKAAAFALILRVFMEALIPAAADKVKVPMLASGGFGDGRGLAAALALGADGINMGTRFCVTKEAPIHEKFKQQMVENDERDTKLIFRTLHNTARVMKNKVSEEVVAIEAKGGAKFEDVQHLVAGVRGRKAMEEGDADDGIWSAGMIQGLIHDIPSVEELIDRIVADAEEIIKKRLNGVVVS